MFLLMLKTELPGGRTSLDFIGAFDSLDDAARHGEGRFTGDTGYGNKRMLSGIGTKKPSHVWVTELTKCGSRYLIAEF